MALLSYLTITHFDNGAIRNLQKVLKQNGISRPLIATDQGLKAAGIVDRLTEALDDPSTAPIYADTPPNPTEAAVRDALKIYQDEGCDGVIGLGGGSSMDLGKAVALLAVSGGELDNYDPLKGGNKNFKGMAPLIAVPTTSGTGSEVSLGFVIIMDDGRKATYGNPNFVPKAAICDPELTYGLPPILTAATGMDAITHCIEAILSPMVNPPCEGVGLDGLWRGWAHVERATKDGQDAEARWQMMMASTEGAMAFVKGLGSVHAMAHAAGRIPGLNLHHGTLNAVILPHLLRHNADAPDMDVRYARLRQAMDLAPGADIAAAVEDMNQRLGLPANLGEMGVTADMIPDLVHHAAADLNGRTNPKPVTPEEYADLFKLAIG